MLGWYVFRSLGGLEAREGHKGMVRPYISVCIIPKYMGRNLTLLLSTV